MSKRSKSIVAFIIIVLLVALVLHPYRAGPIRVTSQGNEILHISQSNISSFTNRSFHATTVLNNGKGHLNLTTRILGAYEFSCYNGTVTQLFIYVVANASIPEGQVPKDLVLAVHGIENGSYYAFLLQNNSVENTTPWPQEGAMNPAEVWSPRSIYDGFKPQSSEFSAGTIVLWRVEQSGSIVISARIYGFGELIESTMKICVG